MLALSLCVVALPVALLDVPGAHSAPAPIASPSVHPDFRVVNVALHVHRHAAVSQSSKAHAVAHVIPVPAQWRTSGPGIAYPSKTDPTRVLPRIDQLAFDCIRRYESRNHLVDGATGGSQGWYQLEPSIWHAAAIALGYPKRLWWSANLATGNQQSAVAVWYFKRNGRFGVEWLAEAGSCPGVFSFS